MPLWMNPLFHWDHPLLVIIILPYQHPVYIRLSAIRAHTRHTSNWHVIGYMWKTTSHVTTTVGAAFSNREWLNLQWLMAWTSNYIPIKLWNMIIRPFSNFKETLDNPSLILESEWVFTSRWKSRIQFLVHLLISIKQCQWKETQISKTDCMA